jgi:hypothetical protein
VEDGAADDLDVEMPHAGRPAGSLADDGEGLGKEIVQGRPLGQLLPELGRFGPQLGVGERLDAGLEFVDGGNDRQDPLEGAVVIVAEQLAGNPLVHLSFSIRKPPECQFGAAGALQKSLFPL